MASTAESITFEEPSRPPEGRVNRYVAEITDPADVQVPGRPESLEAPNFADALEPSGVAAEPSPSPLSVAVDELGQYVVQDVIGGAYGVGRSPEEAFRDYSSALGQRLAFLRSRRDALHNRLARQLRELEALFPGR